MNAITGRGYQGNFPVNYAPAAMPGYPQMPGYGWPGPQQPGPAMPQAPMAGNPQMTKPTVHADIIQIEDEAAGANEPVNAGTSQMMITKDEQSILVKSVLANGETTMDIYRKIPPEAKPEEPEYITREEFEARIAAMIRKAEPVRDQYQEPGTEEAEEHEPIPMRRNTQKTTGGAKRG